LALIGDGDNERVSAHIKLKHYMLFSFCP